MTINFTFFAKSIMPNAFPLLCFCLCVSLLVGTAHGESVSIDNAPTLSLATPQKNIALNTKKQKIETNPNTPSFNKTNGKTSKFYSKKDHNKITNKNKTAKQLTANELLIQPKLLQRAMESVLRTKQKEKITAVLTTYKKMPNADSVLISYAQALVNYADEDYQEAEKGYRQVLAKHPELSVVRFDLAIALYRDKQYSAALAQFQRLKSEPLPKPVIEEIKYGIEAIGKLTEWQFSFNAYYQKEDNINGAPELAEMAFADGNLFFDKPESAEGLHIDINTAKRFNWQKNLYAALRFDASSDYYWDNTDYNELTSTGGVGLGYQTADFRAEVAPYVSKRFLAEESYSETIGARFNLDYQLNNQWRLNTMHGLSSEHFKKRTHLNGDRQFNSLSAVYIRNAKQYWQTGINYSYSAAKQRSNAHNKRSFYVGWGQEWGKGISSHVKASVNESSYKATDFFGILREDTAYAANLSIWKRDWHFWGITPKLVYSWEKIDSNHFYYRKEPKGNMRIEISKHF